MLGLGNLVWAIEKSGFSEWTSRKKVHWSMNSDKLEREGKKAMALTFDDGPNEETEKLLDILIQENVKGTFFLVGSLIPGNEHIVKRIIDEGHDIGVHEWSQEGAKPNTGLKEYGKRFVGPRHDLGDVRDTSELIEKVSGRKPTLGRVAGVHGTIDSRREFETMNLKVIHGNPYDVAFMPPSPKFNSDILLKKALSSNGQGRIRIFHIGTLTDSGLPMDRSDIDKSRGETYPPDATLGMIQQYISESKKQGFEFVKVDEYT
ncbi:MAG: polysaccharide deacetylase family protein [Candidatus Doudnabacteria bacterium]|nr:polysaccharide deacetylase family protein [Candidatus Doudnabacteria bacterium]